MWLSFFAVILILAITFYQGLHGLFSALIMCILTVLSAALAFGMHDAVHYQYLAASQPERGRALALLGIFIVVLLVMRVIMDIVISKNMADEFFPGQDPIGQQLVVDPDNPLTFEVVGVVGDVRMSALGSKPWRAMYLSYLQVPYTTMRIAVRTEVRPELVAGALREVVWSQDGDIPVAGLATMEQAVAPAAPWKLLLTRDSISGRWLPC